MEQYFYISRIKTKFLLWHLHMQVNVSYICVIDLFIIKYFAVEMKYDNGN